MGFEPTIAVESGRAKNRQMSPNAPVGLGILKVTSYKAKRETQEQKGERHYDSVPDSCLLIHHQHQQPT